MNYYNEFDPKIAAWLRQLIADGHIPAGEVDERSIEDVKPGDLRGFVQCHFFAGIGGWSHALDLAGWPRDQRVWTGSCPCQPFSAAGQSAGFADERHLWPAWQHLIAQCRPPIVFGEQVASKAADVWVDLVHTDMENMGYAFGCVPFPSAGVGAPHIRDRLYWVAHASSARGAAGVSAPTRGHQGIAGIANNSGGQCTGVQQRSTDCGLAATGRMADTESTGHEAPPTKCREQSGEWATDAPYAPGGFSGHDEPCPVNGFWRDADWLFCRDGKWRPVEPGTFPLAHGIPARMVRLRGYGNAINPHQAAEFIRASVEVIAA